MLLESLHHDPDEAQQLQQIRKPLLTEDAVPFLLLKYTTHAAKHCTNLHIHTQLTIYKGLHMTIFAVL